MTRLTRWSRPRSGESPIIRHTVGNATVLRARPKISAEARDIALSVQQDDHNDIVLLDLHGDVPMGLWESVAAELRRRRRGIRLVVCGQRQETAALAGQWLSDRLNRTVITPYGRVFQGVAGSLFVHSESGGGWVRHRPGRPPTYDAKRFPQPEWDLAVAERRPTSSVGVAEPLPGGVWIHDTKAGEASHRFWQWLASAVPCQPQALSIVLGSPNTAPLSLDDVARFWRGLDDEGRRCARFIQFGPVALPVGDALGQALADTLRATVVCFGGVPLGRPERTDIFTVEADGRLGWQVFARELAYEPRERPMATAKTPRVLSHRDPVGLGDPVAPLVYWYGPDAVIEVIQSGLWMRPTEAPKGADSVRAIKPRPDRHVFVYDDSSEHRAQRMRLLAEDVVARLDAATRQRSVLAAASTVSSHQAVTIAGAIASDDLPSVNRTATAEQNSAEYTVVSPARASVLSVPVMRDGSDTIVQPQEEAVGGRHAAPVAAGGTIARLPGPAPAAPFTELPSPPSPPQPAGVPASLAEPVQAQRAAGALPSTPGYAGDPAAPRPLPARPAAPDGPETGPPGRPAMRPIRTDGTSVVAPPTARLQPIPEAAASAISNGSQLGEERAWLRRSLSREFDIVASSISRVLSQHPGMQGGSRQANAEVVNDSVAVRLYLSAQGAAIDGGLRSGKNGPHVPFARCVVAGLSLLPSHRGATIFAASPSGEQWELLKNRRLVTEWGFTNALTAPSADQTGEVDVLVWSMTARRTRLLEPDGDDHVDDRVLFMPGTSFKVLDMVEPGADGARAQILLRELAANEIDPNGRVDTDRASFDELARASLQRCWERWADSASDSHVGRAAISRFGALPGLA